MNLQLSELQGVKTSNIIKIATFLLVFLVGFSFNADAQRKKPRSNDKVEDYFDEEGFGSHKLWYGGGIGLNFGGGTNSSQFNFSISPMFGYKITEEFSIGPRAELDYVHARFATGNNTSDKYNIFNYAIGGFARYKVFNPFFAHVEYQLESRADPIGNGETRRGSRDNFFVGGGYGSSGGLIGYEISILWNVLEDGSVDIPLDYRIAFTYNF